MLKRLFSSFCFVIKILADKYTDFFPLSRASHQETPEFPQLTRPPAALFDKKSTFFENFCKIVLHFNKTSVHLQSQNQREAKLRYGVMVALQILALSVRVRVLLSQQSSKTSWRDSSAG